MKNERAGVDGDNLKSYSKSATYKTNRQITLVTLLADLQLTQGEAARQLEIQNRLFRQYCSPIDKTEAPRLVIMALMYLREVNKKPI